jgi:phage-related minor tail protein
MGRPSNLQIRVTSDSRQARSDIQGAESQITGTLGKLKSAGPALALAAGAAIGAALIGGINKALDQSKITGRLGAQLGATPQEAGRLGKLAGRLYAEGITSDFQSAADAISATMRSGLLPTGATEAQIQKIATKAQSLATVFDQDVGGTTRAVSQLLRTGLVKSADEAFDVLTTGFQKGTNAADDLLDTFTEYSTQFRDMGLSAKQALGLIQQGLAGGARDAAIVADALKELNIRVKDKSAAEGLKELGLNADAMAKQFAVGGEKSAQALDLLLDKLNAVKDPAERTRLAVLLLGTQAEDLAGALFNLDPSKAVDALGQVEGAADRMATTLHDNAGAQLDAFKQKAEQTFVEFLGGKVVPELMRFHSWFQDKIMPVVKEVGALYITYLTPILGAVRDGIRKVSEAVKENEQDWIPLWNFIKAKVVPLMGGALAEALSKSFDALALIVKILGDVVGGFKRVKNGIEDVIEWLRKLGAFKVPGWISDIVGLSGLSTTFTQVSKAQPGLMTMRGGIVSTTPAITMTPRFHISPMQVNVTIDGQQLQGRIDRTVRGAFLADGARYAAGGRI